MSAPPEPSYAAAWARYRRIRLLTILLIVTFPLFPPLAMAIAANVIGETAAFVLVLALWIAAVVMAAVRWAYFPCPRCGKKFRRKAGQHVHKCGACGLQMFAENEAEAAPKPYPEQPELEAGSADPTYVAAWGKYHRLQLLRSPWILAGAVLVAAILLPQLGGNRAVGLVAMVWFLGWFLIYATSRWRLLYFRCPRCKRRFHGGVDVTKSEWCAHCRLRLYALADPDAKNELR